MRVLAQGNLQSKLSVYARLVRLHQPVGIMLLMWPCWIATAIASEKLPDIKLLILFAIGALVMRSAGCIINDIADRKFDSAVERTRNRPLACGEVSMRETIAILMTLLLTGFIVLLQLNPLTVAVGVLSLFLVFSYPFMKRITYWPQAFLGLTFNWGVLLGFTAATGKLEISALILYIGFMFWTLAYDTIYAFQDIKDDLRIGVKSTAILFRKNPRPVIAIFFAIFLVALGCVAIKHNFGAIFFLFLLTAAIQMVWQVQTLDIKTPINARRRFLSNNLVGFLIFLGLMMDRFF